MLEVGHITRPHGVRGDVLVMLTTNRTERLSVGAVLSSDSRELVVAHSRPHKGSWIVGFEGIADRDRAESLSGAVLYAEPIVDPNELWVHDLIGASVVDQHGISRGIVQSVVANPACDLLELDNGSLIPVKFLTQLTPNERIVVEVPDGIFEATGDTASKFAAEPATEAEASATGGSR